MAAVLERLREALGDRYGIERELGRGGMATVYLAADLKHGRNVALKVLHPELAASLGAERFLREIQIAAKLAHPHIIALHDSGEAGGLLYFVMPFVEGETLAQRIQRERQLPLDEALRITAEVADALAYAHSLGVIHRDIKPQNILLQSGHAVISDFGIARAVTAAGGERVTETGVAMGTPAYMSPEQAGADRPVDGRTDIYSLGCVLYEMLAGTPPFTASTMQAVMARHALDPVPSLRTVRAMVPGSVEAVILRALAKSPADRYATALEFVEALTSGRDAAPARGAPRLVRCPTCGFENSAGLRFCGECGAELQVEPMPPTTPPSRVEARGLTGERRQLTVMSCNVAAAVPLAEDRDPEESSDVTLGVQDVCATIIERYEGHIAGQLGAELLVYFGYPRAHEDDAWRAVAAGLEMVQCLQERGTDLDVRVAIHTGLVVAGDTGSGAVRSLAIGRTPDLAVRLQEAAPPNSVVVSPETRRLIEALFVWEDLGARSVKGMAEPVELCRVVRETDVESRLEAREAGIGLTPLAGREQELAFLRERWKQAASGAGQVVLLTGDAGIGKSRLVRTLADALAADVHVRQLCRCSAYHQNSALYPVIDLLERGFGLRREDSAAEKLHQLEAALAHHETAVPGVVQLLAELLSVPRGGGHPSLELAPHQRRQKTLEAIVMLLLDAAERQPVLFVVEDLHWADPSTLELLSLIVNQVPTASLLVLLTFRPTFTPPWGARTYQTELTLSALTPEHTAAMVTYLAGGKPLPPEVARQIVAKTDGVPLFVEELTKMVLGSALLRQTNHHYELAASLPRLAIPATLRDSLTARLDRLAATSREVAQLGATIGRRFTHGLLQAVAPVGEAALQRALSELMAAELLYRRGLSERATYFFKHALIQDAAYESLLKSRRREYHQRIGEVLVERFSDIADSQPELVAHHFSEAGLGERAVAWWLQAGQRGARRSAHVEAVAHLTRGLEVIATLPASTERDRQELLLLLHLGGSLTATKGYTAPDVERTYLRARDLAQALSDIPTLFQAASGVYRCYVVQAELHKARALGEQLLEAAERAGDEDLVLEAERTLGHPLLYLGHLKDARRHLERGVTLYRFERHRSHMYWFTSDPGVACSSGLSLALWLLGYPDQALEKARESLTLARQLSHPFSSGLAQAYTAWLHLYRREWQEARDLSEAALELARERGLAIWLGLGTMFRGAALAQLGQLEEGRALLRRGNDAIRATGAALNQPHFLSLLAAALAKAGEIEEALGVLDEAEGRAKQTGDRCWLAEVHRLRGEFLLEGAKPIDEVERCFQQAIEVARDQEAKSLELRAVMSLSRAWRQRGQSKDARQRLCEIYDWFTEGFQTADLRDARALLDELT